MGVGVETGLELGVAVGVGVGVEIGVGLGVAVDVTEDSSIPACSFVVEASPLPRNASHPAASIPLLRTRIKKCFRIRTLRLDAESQRADSSKAVFALV